MGIEPAAQERAEVNCSREVEGASGNQVSHQLHVKPKETISSGENSW